jgi:Zn-dependent M16 (insulinase) family peptidase
LIRTFLLDNSHRVTVEVQPDAALGHERDAREDGRLQVRTRGG